MGIAESQSVPEEIYDWDLPEKENEFRKFIISPVFRLQKEYFVAFINHDLSSLFIYCCSASQWQYDECFTFTISLVVNQQFITTSAVFSHKSPFCSIISRNLFGTISIGISLCKNYPYTRKDHYLGILNSGSTCYMASILQVLYHTGSFRQLMFSYKDAKDALSALQRLFIELQLSSRAPTLDSFIRSLGSFHDLALVQNDAHEFLIAFIERLETDLGESFTNGINQILGGVTTTTIKCKSLLYSKTTDERFYAFPIVVEGLKSLEESLNLVTAKETIKNYDTGELGKDEAEQSLVFSNLPPILSFHLCRFAYNAKSNSVVELRNSFECPFELDMSPYASPGNENGGEKCQYELYAITAHSGNPIFGHYTSYIRPQLGQQWVLFNDGNTKVVDEQQIRRLFGIQNASQPSFFKAFTFTTALAYMLFYVRKDSLSFVVANDSIPLHLAPHRSNWFFSRFIFADELPGKNIAMTTQPTEWVDRNETAENIIRKQYPTKDLQNYKIWAQLPGRSQFIGPMDLATKPSEFVIKGHSTNFYIFSSKVTENPVFVVTETTPRVVVSCGELRSICSVENHKIEHQHRSYEKSCTISPGSNLIVRSKKDITLKIRLQRFAFPADATYSDVQKRLALFFDIQPWRILVLHKMQPMIPHQYPFVATFPTTDLSYQELKDPVTACSIKLFTPITMIYVGPNCTQQYPEPVWVRKGTTSTTLNSMISKYFSQKTNEKYSYLCSIGKLEAIEYVMSPVDSPKKQCIRYDAKRYEVPYLRSVLKKMLMKGVPIGLEIRFAQSMNSFSFEGTSKIISVGKTTTVRDVWKKMINTNENTASQPIQAFLFVSEKPKIRVEVKDEENVFEDLKKFINKMTKERQRLCIALVDESPLNVTNQKPSIVRSLSGIINKKAKVGVEPKQVSQET